MPEGIVEAICISPAAKAPMQSVKEIEVIAKRGIKGDRYCLAQGSYNRNQPGQRQVTLINAVFVEGSEFKYTETRRNIAVRGIELMDQIGHEFKIDGVLFRGVEYCDPCMQPTMLSGKLTSFRDKFHDRGGLIAEVLEGGYIKVGSIVVPRKKSY